MMVLEVECCVVGDGKHLKLFYLDEAYFIFFFFESK